LTGDWRAERKAKLLVDKTAQLLADHLGNWKAGLMAAKKVVARGDYSDGLTVDQSGGWKAEKTACMTVVHWDSWWARRWVAPKADWWVD
jgi:hypothetical protein